jgi:hypothetical protein
MLPLLASLLLSAAPLTPNEVPCQSIEDCWLNELGKPIKRPKRFRGKPLPPGDCGEKLNWLRNKLACEKNVCTALYVGDLC